MVRQLLGNIRGPRGFQGEQGPEGPQGDTGEISNVKTNIVPLNSSQWEDGSITSGNGNPSDTTQHIRTKDYIDVVKGETYTLSDESLYVSAVSAIWVHEYENGVYTNDYFFITRGAQRTFTANGNQIKIVLRAMENFTVQPQFIESTDERIKLKIELGEKTPNLSALNDITRSIDKLSATHTINTGNLINNSINFQGVTNTGNIVAEDGVNKYVGNTHVTVDIDGDVEVNTVYTLSWDNEGLDNYNQILLYDTDGVFTNINYGSTLIERNIVENGRSYIVFQINRATPFKNPARLRIGTNTFTSHKSSMYCLSQSNNATWQPSTQDLINHLG